MTEQAVGQIASTGAVGALLILAVIALIHKEKHIKELMKEQALALQEKDKQIKAEMDARVADSGRFITLAMSLQREVIEAVNKLGDMLAFIEKRDEDKRASPSPRETGKTKPWRE